MVQANASGRSWTHIALWVVKLLVGAAFLYAAVMKLSGNPQMVAEFEKIGLGQGFRILTGVIELTGALLLLVPRTTFAGAVLLAGISGGALIAQLGPLKGDLIHVFVLGGLVLLIGWASRPARLR
ncbi:DoxX family protein [Polymorphobacter arshaanensis]|uniref:DoxX family protein n=1 Tax=Glacieibacterium arshaanense TaxID=2511025 RepID=A0A4Y9ENN0_9SPHN|nr:DoxX family protein [Polymorphobacter arshaanensis]TFU03685.1 DoxX family protein [Polymorphobacter arshaanensis]